MKTIIGFGSKYWRFWVASTLSMAASNILQYILSLYVLDITGSAAIFAGMLSVIMFPRLMLTPFAGASADRYKRNRIMSFVLIGETIVLMGYYTVSEFFEVKVISIFILVVVLEIGEVFYGSAENAIIPDLVDKEYLQKAIAISKSDDGIVFVVSPMIGALIYTKLDLSMAFLIVGMLDLLGALLLINIKTTFAENENKNEDKFIKEFLEGLQIIKEDSFLKRYIIALPLIDACFGATFSVCVCYLLRVCYQLDAYQYGLYNSVTASTTIWVPLLVIPFVNKVKPEKIFKNSTRLIAIEIAFIGLFAFLGMRGYISIIVSVVIITFIDCLTIMEAIPMQISGSILIQTNIDKKYLGRVTATISMITSIAIGAGEFIFGVLNDSIGIYQTIIIGAVGVAIGHAIFQEKASVRFDAKFL
ncbi:MAG: MFS transporter [Butyrivibrio sp.]|nr:MFS transporter [Butyrivibrio sp.]